MGVFADRRERRAAQDAASEERKRQTEETLAKLFFYSDRLEEQVEKLQEVTTRLQGAMK